MAVDINSIQKASSPNPFALLSARTPDGRDNLMAVSWWTYASNHPPMVAVCLSKKGYSGALIEGGGDFVLNLVGAELKDSAFACGTCSGRTVDKAREYGIAMEPSEEVASGRVAGAVASMECRLTQAVDAGDHRVYIAEVVATHLSNGRAPLHAFNGYAALKTAE